MKLKLFWLKATEKEGRENNRAKKTSQSAPGAHTGGWGRAKKREGRGGEEEAPKDSPRKDGQDQAENRGDDDDGAFLMFSRKQKYFLTL